MKYLRGCIINQVEIADDFYEAYKRCSLVDENNRVYSIPAFVNGFLACEIYMKYLLGDRVNKIKRDKHNLRVLFNNLDISQKNELLSFKCDSKYTLNELLEYIGNGFKIWRYCYEDNNDGFGEGRPFEYSEYFLNTFLPIIKEIAHRLYD